MLRMSCTCIPSILTISLRRAELPPRAGLPRGVQLQRLGVAPGEVRPRPRPRPHGRHGPRPPPRLPALQTLRHRHRGGRGARTR